MAKLSVELMSKMEDQLESNTFLFGNRTHQDAKDGLDSGANDRPVILP
jgi:hypothetical protein